MRVARYATRSVRSVSTSAPGLHTGEIELRGEDVAGLTVHIGERVSGQAGPGEVFVSRTVADLVAGSDIELHDVGERQLKGVPGTWQLYRVANA